MIGFMIMLATLLMEGLILYLGVKCGYFREIPKRRKINSVR